MSSSVSDNINTSSSPVSDQNINTLSPPVSDNNTNTSSSPQDSSSFPNSLPKHARDLLAWAAKHKYDPPHREKMERTPGDGRKNHGGPIRITSKDGVLTEYGRKLEEERLAKLAAANESGAKKEAESSS